MTEHQCAHRRIPDDLDMLETRSARARHEEVTQQLAAFGPDACTPPPPPVPVVAAAPATKPPKQPIPAPAALVPPNPPPTQGSLHAT